MGKTTGFIEHRRLEQPYRPVNTRIQDWAQVSAPYAKNSLEQQASRCMDCGIPFCHESCPLGNLIPDWNDLVYRDRWEEAIERLHATNNFPEFTGALCPAPCEGSCVLGINDKAVTIKAVELAIVSHAFEQNLVKPCPPKVESGKKIAIVGSGPAGLTAAQQLRRVGHRVTVFERADRLGGLLRYGIPEFKMEKKLLDRRINQMEQEGISFKTSANVGVDLSTEEILKENDALLLAAGATAARVLSVPGHDLEGVHLAMDFLSLQNRRCEGDNVDENEIASAKDKHVVIIGGGDTGADCLGTSHRQKAASVTSLEILPKPPNSRHDNNPWPEWPRIFRIASAHAEGGSRLYGVSTNRFVGDKNGRLKGLELVDVEQKRENGKVSFAEVPNSKREIPCELALLAMGFEGPEKDGLINQLKIKLDERGNVARDENWMTSVDGIFTAGDMQHGQSLIVWAIAEGRSAAKAIDEYLMGSSNLPAPV
jgi:glutamate synthase (NADPH/NADH) small chain